MSGTIARIAARNGAAKLDRRLPDWAGRIVPGRLDFDSEAKCVLGQAYGHFADGLEQVSHLPTCPDGVVFDVAVFPFFVRFVLWNGFAGLTPVYKRALREAWTEQVAKRQVRVIRGPGAVAETEKELIYT